MIPSFPKPKEKKCAPKLDDILLPIIFPGCRTKDSSGCVRLGQAPTEKKFLVIDKKNDTFLPTFFLGLSGLGLAVLSVQPSPVFRLPSTILV